jgi:hypothetical protein
MTGITTTPDLGDDGSEGEGQGPPWSAFDDPMLAELDHVEQVFGVNDDIQLITYDANEVELGRITLSRDGESFNLISEYSDGSATLVIADGEVTTTEGNLPAGVLVQRASKIVDILATGPQQKGGLGCAVKIGVAVGLCAPLAAGQWWGVVTCPAGVITAWCECAEAAGYKDGGLCGDL